MSDINKKLGDYLKSKRKEKGYTIDEMSESLKITAMNITDIENGNLDSIGLSEVFVKSYIKSYITELGEVSEDVFNRFDEFQNKTRDKEKKVISTNTILYSPAILITAVMMFSALSYLFISHVTARDKELMDMTPDTKVEDVIDVADSSKKTFSKDYDSIYSNYSETPR